MVAALCWAENILVSSWNWSFILLFFYPFFLFLFATLYFAPTSKKNKNTKIKKMITLKAKTCGKRMTQFKRSARQQVKANRYRLGVSTFRLQLFISSSFD